MFSRWRLAVILLSVLCVSGCSTIEGLATGMQKDAKSAWSYMNDEDGWMKKTDNWMQEHMW